MIYPVAHLWHHFPDPIHVSYFIRSLRFFLSLAVLEKELLRGLGKGSGGGEPRTHVLGAIVWLSWGPTERTGGHQ